MENEGKFDETSYLTELSVERDKLPTEYQHASRLLNQEIQRNQPGAGKDGQTTKPPILDIHKGRPLKLLVRVSVPIKDHPNFNFIGKLLGPKGNSLKRLQEETQTRMAILGRGSMRDKAKEEELRGKGDPKYSHLNEELHVEISAFALPSDAYARMAHALSEVKRFLVPDYYDEIRQDQLRELAVLNGTPGAPPQPPPKPGFNQPPPHHMPPGGAPPRLGRPVGGRGRGYPPPPPPPAPGGRGAGMPGPPKPSPAWRPPPPPPPRALPPPPAVSGAGRGMMKQRLPEGGAYPPQGRGGLHDNGHPSYESAYKDQDYGNVYEEMAGAAKRNYSRYSDEEYAEPYQENYDSNYAGEQGGYGGDQAGYGDAGYAEPGYSEPGYGDPDYMHEEWGSGVGRGGRLKSMPAPRSLNRANVRSHPYGPPPPVPY